MVVATAVDTHALMPDGADRPVDDGTDPTTAFGNQPIWDGQEQHPVLAAGEGVVERGAGSDVDTVGEGVEIEGDPRATGKPCRVASEAVGDIDGSDGEVTQALEVVTHAGLEVSADRALLDR